MNKALKVVLVIVALVGAVQLGSFVIHKFATFGAVSKEGEAKRELRRLCIAQLATLIDIDAGATTLEGLQATVENNRYTYFLSPGAPAIPAKVSITGAVTESSLPPTFAGGLKLGQNGDTWVLAAAGNIDGDPALDIWSVATAPRTGPDGTVPRCVPVHEVDDINPG